MTRMLDSLEEFVQLDTPFLINERNERLERLRAMMPWIAENKLVDKEKN